MRYNLCDTCEFAYPECPSDKDHMIFGDGIGDDNVIACGVYKVDKPRWIPVTERLPEMGEVVIVAVSTMTGKYIVQTSFLMVDNTFTIEDVCMWMPLPEPPKEET